MTSGQLKTDTIINHLSISCLMTQKQCRPETAIAALLCVAFSLPALSEEKPVSELEKVIASGQPLETAPAGLEPEPQSTPRYSVPAILHMPQPRGFNSVQVNTAANGMNIVGDAANEPSLAVSPVDPDLIVIGWRQFASVNNGFREAGVGFSTDAGASWTYPGNIEPGVFRSDPVLGVDRNGTFYYASLKVINGNDLSEQFFTSTDGGATWSDPVEAFGGDKLWFTVDNSSGSGDGHVYSVWNTAGNPFFPATFNRSINRAQSFQLPLEIPQRPVFGTAAVGPDGELYVVGTSAGQMWLLRSDNARNALEMPTFDQVTAIDLGGPLRIGSSINPAGLLGQAWVAVDHSDTSSRGNVYVLASIDPAGADPLDVILIRSEDSGVTFSQPLRINDDATDNGAWQWFGTLSVAPNGRLDVIWYDTRNDATSSTSQVFYTFSNDRGQNFMPNMVATPAFDQSLGYPTQNKLGDYIDMKSDLDGAHIAYAATFNGEQDVYYLFAEPELTEEFFTDGFEN